MEKAFLTITSAVFGSSEETENVDAAEPARLFVPERRICDRDTVIVDMLNSTGHEDVCYCVCDPHKDDCPIVYASPAFCSFTGYSHDEIEGRNCRFLQGPLTDQNDVKKIRNAIASERETNVNLLNYKKDGTTFVNEFFLSPLRDDEGKTLYFIGVQVQVPNAGPGQMPANPGWIYTQGNHA